MSAGTNPKIKAGHLERQAIVYVRQSTMDQVRNCRESQDLQYSLTRRAHALGWPKRIVQVIDEDLGFSGASADKRLGFQQLVAQVSLGQVGIVLGYEVSRLARNNRDWYHLLDLCAIFDTLIADNDGVYNPADYNDRLLLGLKGTISEAELHVMRGRLNAGLRNKARKGELILGLPVGYRLSVDGMVIKDPDESIQRTLGLIFEKFQELENVTKVFHWFLDRDVNVPRLARRKLKGVQEVSWEKPVYSSFYNILRSPFYAGAYFFGRTRRSFKPNADGRLRAYSQNLPISEWEVLIRDHHEAFLSWDRFVLNQEILRSNRRMGEVDERSRPGRGQALLQGLVRCGQCGRMMRVEYSGEGGAVPRYVCRAGHDNSGIDNCQSTGARRIDLAVASEFLKALAPARIEAIAEAVKLLQQERSQLAQHWALQVEKAEYEADRARRQYQAVEPENRLVARDLERRWNEKLEVLQEIRQQSEKQATFDAGISDGEIVRLQSLGKELRKVWDSSSTSIEDQKQLLRTLIDEVIIFVDREACRANTTIVWHGATRTQLEVPLNKTGHHHRCASDEVVELVRHLSKYLPDRVLAETLNRQGRRTGQGNPFNRHRVASLRQSHGIPAYQPGSEDTDVCNIAEAAKKLKVSTTTIHRWLKTGVLDGIQVCPGAPWLIRITDGDVSRLKAQNDQQGYSLQELAQILGASKADILKKIQSGELEAQRVQDGRRSRWKLSNMPFVDPAEDGQLSLEYDC